MSQIEKEPAMERSKEEIRIYDTLEMKIPIWRKWGAFVSERQWGSVREDYSADGDAWRYFTHDMARSRAYRWGEDAIAGWCDQMQMIVFGLCFWNGKDPILKERHFGLTPNEGNHGEDLKEYFYYLDATPTHSYTKFLYKYPQAEFPYQKLIDENKKRGPHDREYELVDTGVFNEGRYFDIVVEYAKESPEDTCIRIEIFNRGPESARLHVLPQLWFRNRWSWDPEQSAIPEIRQGHASKEMVSLYADTSALTPPDWVSFDYKVPSLYLYGDKPSELLFTNNESNNELLYGPQAKSRTPYVKDAFHRYVIHREACLNPTNTGTKAAFHYESIEIPSKGSHVIRMRLSPAKLETPLTSVDRVIEERKKEADAFYDTVHTEKMTPEERKIQRQALAGMFWCSQFYYFDVRQWLEGDDPKAPPPESRQHIRNYHWKHLHTNHVICMPDKWEYPWFASWDCSFHAVVLSLADIPFAKKQLKDFLSHLFQHPNGQVPAYEWGFSDTNPPVQAWALWSIYEKEKQRDGRGDHDFLELCFLKLMNNFSWWVNKVDRLGNNVFEGGFLGLDNISIIDRSKPLPDGGFFEQSDATGWMGLFSLLMMKMALELSKTKPLFQSVALVYFEHFVKIAWAMEYTQARPLDLWDNEDGFFYDVMLHPDGSHQRLKVRSFVGLIPFFSLDFFEEKALESHPHFYKHFKLFIDHHRSLLGRSITEVAVDGTKRYLFSLMSLDQMKRLLQYAWNPEEFLSPYGLRSVSKIHEKKPFVFHGNVVNYEPGESFEKIKGGNSNWRGPIWFPTNYLFACSLHRLTQAVGSNFSIEIGNQKVSLFEMTASLKTRLIDLFRKNEKGERPVHGDQPLFQKDPYWKDLLFFYEHYHGDVGRGLGASHQTGWSGLVANLIAELDS
jgi:hypothetical protein